MLDMFRASDNPWASLHHVTSVNIHEVVHLGLQWICTGVPHEGSKNCCTPLVFIGPREDGSLRSTVSKTHSYMRDTGSGHRTGNHCITYYVQEKHDAHPISPSEETICPEQGNRCPCRRRLITKKAISIPQSGQVSSQPLGHGGGLSTGTSRFHAPKCAPRDLDRLTLLCSQAPLAAGRSILQPGNRQTRVIPSLTQCPHLLETKMVCF
ncbi:hypothetical protein F5Y13DRAFT_32960 [Hypoxylon sp. FL1857]|nr:hypothetical protein F5Y13DRAFT_32960 [Hypoxylon sp. FL1857]